MMVMLLVAAAVVLVLILVVALYLYNSTPKLPPGFNNGDTVQCPGDGAIYLLEDNVKKWYPTPDHLGRRGWPTIKHISCQDLAKIKRGSDVP